MPKLGPKPAKPSPDFPLFAHASGTWAKKIDNRHVHFGPWNDPEGALKNFEERYAARLGRPVVSRQESVTVSEVVNRFLTARFAKIAEGELQRITYEGYRAACRRFCDIVGRERTIGTLLPDDFRRYRERVGQNRGAAGLAGDLRTIRMAFNFCVGEHIIDALPRYGEAMKLPSKKRLRQERNARGPRVFSREELQKLIGAAKPPVKAMILLGINCGLGNTDVARLRFSHLDLDSNWLNYPRPKTEYARECYLWPETVEALREAIRIRPNPQPPKVSSKRAEELKDIVFLTRRTFQPWVRFKIVNKRFQVEDAIVCEFRKLLTKFGIARPRAGFYWLRHCTETIGSKARDQIALNHIMGHVDPSMAAHYREYLDRERIIAVSQCIHDWLYQGNSDALL